MNTKPCDLTNEERASQLKEMLADLLRWVLQPAFHGAAALEFTVQDGVIQHIRRRVEQIEK
ncbi:MAG: hypothetical protein KJZ87_17810 [Thermoguttaceae bacterium]|nr:hypothetical protein [Thermoguttaceae bacterium]